MIRFLFALTLVLTTAISAHAEMNPIDKAILNIKNYQTHSGHLVDAGLKIMAGGVGVSGAGVVLRSIMPAVVAAYGGELVTNLLIKGGPHVFRTGLFLSGIGAVVAVFEPLPARAATVTDYFRTPEGFQEYLKLSPEEMKTYAEMNPELEKLVLSFSKTLNYIQE